MLGLENVTANWRDLVDIALVTALFYRIIVMVKDTRAVSAIYGLLLLVVTYFVSRELGLYTLGWLLESFFGSLFLVIIVLFQRDIRQALTDMGARSFFRKKTTADDALNEIIGAALYLAQRKIGALIVMIERGVKLGAALSRELLITIFFPKTPLHDGAVIIRKGEVAAAACILPLATVDRQDFGTRHRAALGITEESDAVAVVVSEERGAVTVAVGGKLTTSLDATRLKRVLKNILEK